MTGTSRGAAGQ